MFLDKDLAKKYYKKAINQLVGVKVRVLAYEELAQMYEVGEGVQTDTRRASKYYLFAAEKLSKLGQWKTAIAFEKGVGLRKNTERAVHFFKLCANSGHQGAQRKILGYYMKGHGLERSRVHARKIMEQTAKEVNRDAKRWLVREELRDALVHIRRWSL